MLSRDITLAHFICRNTSFPAIYSMLLSFISESATNFYQIEEDILSLYDTLRKKIIKINYAHISDEGSNPGNPLHTTRSLLNDTHVSHHLVLQ